MLGDAICNTPECTTGEAQINQMDSVFQSAPANVQTQFQGAHDAIMSSFNAIYGITTNWIPFNPDCCTIGDLGNQAVALQSQILSAMGQSGTTLTPSGGFQLPSLQSVTSLLIVAGIVYLVVVLKPGK